MRNKRIFTLLLSVFVVVSSLRFIDSSWSQETFSEVSKENKVPVSFVALVVSPPEDRDKAFEYISKNWEPTFPVMIVEAVYLSQDPATALLVIRKKMRSFKCWIN